MNHNLMMLVMAVPSHLEGCISYSSVAVMKHHGHKWFMEEFALDHCSRGVFHNGRAGMAAFGWVRWLRVHIFLTSTPGRESELEVGEYEHTKSPSRNEFPLARLPS